MSATTTLRVERLSERLTSDYLEYSGVLPLRLEEHCLVIASWREPDPQAVDELSIMFDTSIVVETWPEHIVRAEIQRAYGDEASTANEVLAEIALDGVVRPDDEAAIDDLRHLANEAPVVKLVNLFLLEALESRASDVHLESYTEGLRVRYRVDGVLQDAAAPPRELAPAIVSRLKIMADLDIAERRVPQDGRIRVRLLDRQVDVRVSTLPALHGESVVLRLLDQARGQIALGDLGMSRDMLANFQGAIARPHGIVLATGPTGSGKTTTLYAAIQHIRTGREKILTVEDPIEYQLPGVPQVAVNERVGLSFASALRALLRQDPDVMLVGEIRDGETAEIATQASLTGHLVLSTLHTNDAVGALTRLVDLGVAPFLVASTVEAVLAQRLVRCVCEHCATERPMSDDERRALAVEESRPMSVMEGKGCAQCRGTGYRGRRGIYELLVIDSALRDEIMLRRGADHLRVLASERGMRTLRMDGIRLVDEGVTTPAEILRVTSA